ncbi:MAG: hypothetical protein N3D20_00650 [Candidatus Pacearchaeota archaeon]|nr:hypothetical protein [Candidatus Pacearchaeota archaeon]
MNISTNKWLGILLILAAILIWVPLPIPSKETISALIIISIAIYHFIK